MATSRVRPGTALALCDTALMLAAWPLVLRAMAAGPAAMLFALAMPGSTYALGLYRRDAVAASKASLGRLPVAAGGGGLLALAALTLLPHLMPGASAPPVLFPLAFTLFLAVGTVSRAGLVLLRRRGWFRGRILVWGAGARAWELGLLLRREGRQVAYDVAFAYDRAGPPPDPRLDADMLQPMGNRALMEVAQDFAADMIVVAPDERRGMPLDALMACKLAGFPVREYLAFLERELGRVDMKRLDPGWLLYGEGFSQPPLERWAKRGCDLLVSLTMLVVLSPFLVAAAVAALLDDGFPLLYRQERVTRSGRRFHILKLRTMRRDAERAGATWAAQRDPRVTRAGAFLRRTRLDELPQLLNVLAGSMSLVGPRPERPEFVDSLARQIPFYRERHAVKAGLTGWAQVNYPYGASIDDARSKLSYDLYYIKRRSLGFDLLILAQTIRAVVWPSGAR